MTSTNSPITEIEDSRVQIQYGVPRRGVPASRSLRRYAATALPMDERRVTIRIVGRAESRRLNKRFRGKDAPTNVLSFPAESLPGLPVTELGDLAICAPVVADEAAEQGKAAAAHWAHMVIHGILHLRGYDHEEPGPAGEMEAEEQRCLARLGFPDPYVIEVNSPFYVRRRTTK